MIASYFKAIALSAIVIFSGFVGFSIEKNKFDRYKAEQMLVTQQLKDHHQAAADRIEKVKNDQISIVNTKLAAALVLLRQRPDRPAIETTNVTAYGTGASLYAEDGGFLIGEAARADKLRSALEACYAQYDSLSK